MHPAQRTHTHTTHPQAGMAEELKVGGRSVADILAADTTNSKKRGEMKGLLVKELIVKRLPNSTRDGLEGQGAIVREGDRDAVSLSHRRALEALDGYAREFFAQENKPFSAKHLSLELVRLDKEKKLGKGKLATLMGTAGSGASSFSSAAASE